MQRKHNIETNIMDIKEQYHIYDYSITVKITNGHHINKYNRHTNEDRRPSALFQNDGAELLKTRNTNPFRTNKYRIYLTAMKLYSIN